MKMMYKDQEINGVNNNDELEAKIDSITNKKEIISLTQAEYDELDEVQSDVFYVITDSEAGSLAVDDALSDTSTNPVQNKVVNEALGTKIANGGLGLLYNLAIGTSKEKYPLIYTHDDKNLNFRWENSNGTIGYTNMEGLVGAIRKAPIRVVQYRNCDIAGGKVISNEVSCGAVFEIPFNANQITFTLENDVYCQYGTANDDGILPDLISTGANRSWFSVATYKGEYSIPVQGNKGRFFIGGNAGMTVSNIHVSEWC